MDGAAKVAGPASAVLTATGVGAPVAAGLKVFQAVNTAKNVIKGGVKFFKGVHERRKARRAARDGKLMLVLI